MTRLHSKINENKKNSTLALGLLASCTYVEYVVTPTIMLLACWHLEVFATEQPTTTTIQMHTRKTNPN